MGYLTFAACTPCAAVREDWAAHLRDTASRAGTGEQADAGVLPHLVLFLERDALSSLAQVLDAEDLLPTTASARIASVERHGRRDAAELRVALAFRTAALFDNEGIPSLRMGLDLLPARSVLTIRTPRVDVELPLRGRVYLTAPLLIDRRGISVPLADAVLEQLHLEPTSVGGALPVQSDEPWIEERLERLLRDTFRSVSGRVALVQFDELPVGRDRVPLFASAVGIDDDVLRIDFVTPLRPGGTFDPVAPALPSGGAAWLVHPGIVAADIAALLLDGRTARLGTGSGSYARFGLLHLDVAPGLVFDGALRRWQFDGGRCDRYDFSWRGGLPSAVRRGSLASVELSAADVGVDPAPSAVAMPDREAAATLFAGMARRARLWLGGPSFLTADGAQLRFAAEVVDSRSDALVAIGVLVLQGRSYR